MQKLNETKHLIFSHASATRILTGSWALAAARQGAIEGLQISLQLYWQWFGTFSNAEDSITGNIMGLKDYIVQCTTILFWTLAATRKEIHHLKSWRFVENRAVVNKALCISPQTVTPLSPLLVSILFGPPWRKTCPTSENSTAQRLPPPPKTKPPYLLLHLGQPFKKDRQHGLPLGAERA